MSDPAPSTELSVTGAGPTGARSGSRRLLGATLIATIAANLPSFLVGGLAVQMRDELDFGARALGIAVGIFFAAGALSSPVTGRLVERFGAARSLRWSTVLAAVVQLTVAIAGHSIITIGALLAIGGLANAWAQPASNVLLADAVPPHRLGLALGLQKSAIPAAALLGGLAVPLIALTVGWRWAFVGGALFSALAWTIVPAHDPVGAHTARRARTGRPDVAVKHLAFLALGVGFGSAASNALSAFLVSSGVEAGLGAGAAGVMLTVGSIAGMGVRLLVGAFADRAPGRTLVVMASMFVVASASFLLLATERTVWFVIGTPLAFATAYAWPGLFHLAVVRSNPSAPGVATGIAMTGTLTGAVTGPIVFGSIVGAGSYQAAWLAGAGFLAVAATVVFIARRHVIERPAGWVAPVDHGLAAT